MKIDCHFPAAVALAAFDMWLWDLTTEVVSEEIVLDAAVGNIPAIEDTALVAGETNLAFEEELATEVEEGITNEVDEDIFEDNGADG